MDLTYFTVRSRQAFEVLILCCRKAKRFCWGKFQNSSLIGASRDWGWECFRATVTSDEIPPLLTQFQHLPSGIRRV